MGEEAHVRGSNRPFDNFYGLPWKKRLTFGVQTGLLITFMGFMGEERLVNWFLLYSEGHLD